MNLFETIKRRYGIYSSCLELLNRQERKRVRFIVLLQVFFTGIDVVAVGLVAVLGALMVTGIQSQSPGNRITQILELLKLDQFSFQTQIALLAVLTASLLVIKTLMTMVFFRKQVFFLTRVSARISKLMVSRILSTPYLQLQKKSIFNYVYAISSGISSVTNGVIGTSISLFSDLILLVALIISLFVVDPLMGLLSTSFFGFTSLIIYRLQSQKARKYGHEFYGINIKGEKALNDVLNTQKEMMVKSRLGTFEKSIHDNRDTVADIQANMTFMPSVPRYLLDLVLVVGGVVICGVQFIMNDARVAFATLSVFLVASSRMLPALVRIQQGLVILRSSVATAEPFLSLNSELPEIDKDKLKVRTFGGEIEDFVGSIDLKDVDFTYGTSGFALQSVTLSISENSFCAIAGPSGAGKTTLVDLMLGIVEPSSGTAEISGMRASKALSRYSGAIAYLPQDVQIIEGTIRDNVILGFNQEEITDVMIWQALEAAQLSDLVKSLPDQLDARVGMRGVGLSGGQKQRLAIARAIVTKPKILFLDEATSSLDTETEEAVTDALHRLKGKITLVVIAHRLSTIKNADKVIYLKDGKVLKVGSLKEVSQSIPRFTEEADLLDFK